MRQAAAREGHPHPVWRHRGPGTHWALAVSGGQPQHPHQLHLLLLQRGGHIPQLLRTPGSLWPLLLLAVLPWGATSLMRHRSGPQEQGLPWLALPMVVHPAIPALEWRQEGQELKAHLSIN